MSALMLTFAAKRAIVDLLSVELPDTQVAYAFPRDPEREVVYLGNARSTRTQALAEFSAAVAETCVVDVWARVASPDGDVRSTEQDVESLAIDVIEVLYGHRQIGGGFTFNDVTATFAPDTVISPNPEPMIVSRLLMSVSVRGVG